MRTLDQIGLGSAEHAALEEAVRLLKTRFPVERVILFGSKARGDAGPESDLDLLVLTTRELSWREQDSLVDSLFDIQLAHDVLLSPLAVARQDWENGPYKVLPIHAEVERDGILL
jgi:predicted nucleotidyltransferase